MRHVEVDRTGRCFFYILLSFWGKGEGAPTIIRRAGAMFGSCGLLFTSAMSVASHRWISSAWRQLVFFMFAMAKKVRSKAVEHLSLRGPMLSARFGHGSAFRSGGRGFFFFFFLGREESLFLSFSSCWAGRALVRIRGCFFLYALESENCSYIIYT